MKHPYRFVLHRLLLWARRSASILWLVLVAAYLIVSATQAIIRNYHSQQDTALLQKQLADGQLEEQRLKALIVYYGTDSFKEKELRRTLLMKKPTEKMYALPESGVTRSTDDAITTGQKSATAGIQLPIWQQWVVYLLQGK
jgi:cell division protein FtsB